MHRRQDIELLRIVAAFGIVWFHARAPGAAIAYAGLVVFLVLSTWLGPQTTPPPNLQSVGRRARRLLLPWAIWFVVYGSYNAARGGGVFLDLRNGPVAAVMSGSNIHLWYLPFIFLCLNTVDLVQARARPIVIASIAGVGACVITAAAPLWRPITLAQPYPLLQWADAAAPVLFGLFLRNASALPRPARLLLLGGSIAAAALSAPAASVGISYAIGFACCAMLSQYSAATWRLPALQAIADLSFGIYLSHILVLETAMRWGVQDTVVLSLATFAVSAALVAALRAVAPGLRSSWS